MKRCYINGPVSLVGNVKISGSKNSALPILFTSLLSEEFIKIKNVPKIKDVKIAIKLLIQLGVKITWKNSIYLDASRIYLHSKLDAIFAKKIRASIWILGPLLARFGYAKIPLPGGCNIGNRPIDLHIKGLEKLGAKFTQEQNGIIKALVFGRLKGTYIFMKKVSVGATITVMSAATLASGITTIDNAACEPEVVDVANFLKQLGANIWGIGTKKIVIIGVQKLFSKTKKTYKIIPDRIETGTFLVAATISQGNITCLNTNSQNLKNVLIKLRETGATINIGDNWINLNMQGRRPKPVNIQTAPYPGFPTDMQALFTLINLVSIGTGFITETVFNNRFKHIPELIRMGAKAIIKKNSIICHGVPKLFSAHVKATDLRSSASLILAGCIAEGTTVVNNMNYVTRGYESIEKKLRLLGGKIKTIK